MSIEKRFNQHRSKFEFEPPEKVPGMIGGSGVLVHKPSGAKIIGVPSLVLQQCVLMIVKSMTDAELATTDAELFLKKAASAFEPVSAKETPTGATAGVSN